jgi:hypothetical protein
MSLGVHALDDIGVLGGRIDLSLVDVGTGDEEGTFGVVGLEQIQDMGGISLKWAVVEGKSNSSGLGARVDATSSIGDVAILWTGNCRRIKPSRCLVLATSGTIFIVASRRIAVVCRGATPYSQLASESTR